MASLYTERLLLNKLRETDAPKMAALGNNLKISRVLSDRFPSPYTIEDALSFVAYSRKKEIFALRLQERPDEFVGCIEIILKTDIARLNGEMAYWLGEPFWGKGYMSEALERMTEYGFEVLGLHRLYARAFPFNPASARVLEKCGFRKEAVLKEALIKDGKIFDDCIYTRLRGS